MSATKYTRRIEVAARFFDDLLAVDPILVSQDKVWRSKGYRRTRARLDRRRDGTYTARVVWRNPAALVRTVTFTVEGILLS